MPSVTRTVRDFSLYAALYLQAQGIRTQADNVQIISGAQQGIDIVAKALLNLRPGG
ncbi:hypothetical protein SPTER_37160 [Sporomusa termitida]|uniref:Uncharacterized protein n=1 Tax=Sporomusa termitida TaxID=2377 RepID=A0A517DY54_9FIRM|nr:hypothetical protein SPTER_37160 [Sporomusa termitida]